MLASKLVHLSLIATAVLMFRAVLYKQLSHTAFAVLG